jgi:DNA segregation ATPase FtsK/SpoIIIE-like protein
LDRLIGHWKSADGEKRASSAEGREFVQPGLPSLAAASEPQPDLLPGAGDEMFGKAIELVRAEGRASTTLLQRRLRIGYARAARIIEALEEEGIVGPDQGGSRGREVLVTEEP